MFGNLASFNQLSLSTIYIYSINNKIMQLLLLKSLSKWLKMPGCSGQGGGSPGLQPSDPGETSISAFSRGTRDDDLKNLELCFGMDTLYIRSSSMASLQGGAPVRNR